VRLFELTINVYAPDEGLPATFNDWAVLAFGINPEDINSTPTTLEKVRELRYPLSKDIVDRRGERRSFSDIY
jgi:hypothetical protein